MEPIHIFCIKRLDAIEIMSWTIQSVQVSYSLGYATWARFTKRNQRKNRVNMSINAGCGDGGVDRFL